MRIAPVLLLAVFSLTFRPALCPAAPATATIRIATYNVENYLDQPVGTRRAKSDMGRAKVRESLLKLDADVVAFQEMGSTNALLELRRSLKDAGLDYPHWEHITGWDTNIHLAILSRHPIVARNPHTNDNYLLMGRRLQVSRGYAEVEIQPADNYRFTLVTAHLKSRRPVPVADQAEMRLKEAEILRQKVDARLRADPDANIIVLGDFNDTQNNPPIKTLLGRGRNALVDLRPAERNGDNLPHPNPRYSPRNITWTHYYGVEDSYSRIDYIMVSPGMEKEWIEEETYILTLPNWGQGSDHRPVVATFVAEDR